MLGAYVGFTDEEIVFWGDEGLDKIIVVRG